MTDRIFRPVPFSLAPAEKAAEEEAVPEPAPAPPKRATRRPPVVRSLAHLTPSFRAAIGGLLADMHTAGYSPRVWETLRTPERGAWLQAQGRSKNGARSMHIYGVAADIICGEHRWRCPGTCGFFGALGAAAQARGLEWGGAWRSFVDRPHVQMIPVRDQNAIRESADIEATLRELDRG